MLDNHISALVNEPTFFSGLRTTASFALYLFYSGRYKDRKRIYTMLNKFQNKIKKQTMLKPFIIPNKEKKNCQLLENETSYLPNCIKSI